VREGGIRMPSPGLVALIVIDVIEVAWRPLSDKRRDQREEDADQNGTGLEGTESP